MICFIFIKCYQLADVNIVHSIGDIGVTGKYLHL